MIALRFLDKDVKCDDDIDVENLGETKFCVRTNKLKKLFARKYVLCLET